MRHSLGSEPTCQGSNVQTPEPGLCACAQLQLLHPQKMRRLKAGGTLASRQAIVHSLVHIEGWAIGELREALAQAMHLVTCFHRLCLRQTSAIGVVCALKAECMLAMRQATLHACVRRRSVCAYLCRIVALNSQAHLLDFF